MYRQAWVVGISYLHTFPVSKSLFLFKLGSGHLEKLVFDLLAGPQAALPSSPPSPVPMLPREAVLWAATPFHSWK